MIKQFKLGAIIETKPVEAGMTERRTGTPIEGEAA